LERFRNFGKEMSDIDGWWDRSRSEAERLGSRIAAKTGSLCAQELAQRPGEESYGGGEWQGLLVEAKGEAPLKETALLSECVSWGDEVRLEDALKVSDFPAQALHGCC